MKRLFMCSCALLLLILPLEARINLLEPWFPGQDLMIGKMYSYQPTVAVVRSNALTEIPFSFAYVPSAKMEVGGRWGIRSFSGNTGISDLLIGAKYLFLDGISEETPRIIGEAALSLPTGNSNQGLGSGNVGLLLHWALEKQIQPVVASFGLGVQLNSENSSQDKLGNIFSYHAGASYPYDKQWKLYGEFKGFNHASSKISGVEIGESYQELYLAPGADFIYSPQVTLSGALMIGLTPESQKLGILLGAKFQY